jgi:ABC-type transport system involved in cytochrome bd biosynthesis fused ATPase/permease subunit
MRVRNRLGALSRFSLDALRGGVMLRAHGAERAMQREHGALLGEWARARISQQATIAAVETGQLALTLGISAWLVTRYLSRTRDLPGLLLLAYWTLDLSALGESAANAAWQYPRLRNVLLRLTEPLNAPDDTAAGSPRAERPPSARGIAIRMSNVTARANGHTILANIDIEIPAGQHVAIVGESGAGKSTLVGLLLGWLRPATGEITIDGQPLVGSSLQELRDCTAWIDPTVQLWNRSLFDNLVYGSRAGPPADLGQVLDDAQLHECIRHLPDGLRTSVGEDGTLLSGGEGQRARIGRGLLHKDARLVILDEPARGLDRYRRTEILATCRSRWPDATMLCVTHDVAETVGFDRVLVVHRGAIAEDGPPSALIGMGDSRYSRMLTGDRGAAAHLWSGDAWRRLVARRGAVDEVAL